MPWVDVNSQIPIRDTNFQDIINGLVFNCPSSTEHKEKDGNYDNGKTRYKRIYRPVSVRNVSFRNKRINGGLFNTIMAQIRRPLMDTKTYALIKQFESVESRVNSILSSTALDDPYFELAVFQKRSDMADPEAFYYYIRNAFAHGSFEVIRTNNNNVYLLESSKDGVVKARMRLKEASLLEYVRIANLTPAEIKALRKHRKR